MLEMRVITTKTTRKMLPFQSETEKKKPPLQTGWKWRRWWKASYCAAAAVAATCTVFSAFAQSSSCSVVMSHRTGSNENAMHRTSRVNTWSSWRCLWMQFVVLWAKKRVCHSWCVLRTEFYYSIAATGNTRVRDKMQSRGQLVDFVLALPFCVCWVSLCYFYS